ncbi:GNAT family N-acetyltransferase [Microbacteriaceae bacterium 4G12]
MLVHIRKATMEDVKGIASVHVKSWKETYKGIVKDEVLRNLDFEKKAKDWEHIILQNKPNHFIYVAENNQDEIVGFAVGGKNRSKQYEFEGELYAIYILTAYQKQGIGKRLFATIAEELFHAGFQSMLIWVLQDNPSRSFYECYSPKLIDTAYLESLEVEEVAYGWDDIRHIIK